MLSYSALITKKRSCHHVLSLKFQNYGTKLIQITFPLHILPLGLPVQSLVRKKKCSLHSKLFRMEYKLYHEIIIYLIWSTILGTDLKNPSLSFFLFDKASCHKTEDVKKAVRENSRIFPQRTRNSLKFTAKPNAGAVIPRVLENTDKFFF